MFAKRNSLIVPFFMLGLLVGSAALGSVIDRRVESGADDAEQFEGGGFRGSTSTDLELPYEDVNQVDLQVVGVRFTNIWIPPGAPIVSAYLQFQVDEIQSVDEPVNLIIDGELAADTVDFVANAEIEARPRTLASVSWGVPDWTTNNEQGPDQRSGDLAAIIREIVNQPGWASGNSIVLIISDDPSRRSLGRRCAVSRNDADGPSGAPLLHIEYLSDFPTQPQPADGEVVTDTSVLLWWSPGDYRRGSNVYFGDNRANVEAGTGGTDLGLTYRTGYPISGLKAGTTYYWRIVDVNDSHPDSPWASEVWTFSTMSANATLPDPFDGSINVRNDVTLSWDAGMNMADHNIFIGTDRNTVLNSTTATFATAGTSWQPAGFIDNGQTYYWRIDTNDTSGEWHKGEVWSFSTLPAIAIIDPNLIGWWTFEEYSGSYAFDQSGHDNSGIFAGDPQRVAGYDGKGVYLDGDDFVSIDEVADDIDSNSFSLSAWVKTTTSDCDWYSCNEATGGGNVLIFSIVDGAAAVLDANNAYEGLGTIIVSDGQWHMLTYVSDGTTGYIYVDAVLESTHEANINFSPDDRWSLGQEWDGGGPTEFLTGTIDDARMYNRALTGVEITGIMRIDPDCAWNPSPQQGSTIQLSEMAELEWSAGDNAQMHDVYFGTDRDEVASADTTTAGIYKGRRSASYFDAGEVALGTAYFWRIDEYNTDSSISKGFIWYFTIDDNLLVDDFEIYTHWSFPGNNIYDTWQDGFGDCVSDNGNKTAASVSENPDPPGPALDGQSMRYDFDHDGLVYSPCSLRYVTVLNLYSKVEAQVALLASGIGSDWAGYGARALQLSFHGEVGNAMSESLWVQLRDSSGYGSKVFYGDFGDESLADFNEASWHVWDMDLADFGVDLHNVVSLVIGIGDEGSSLPGGSGTLYFDDIRLYAPRFISERLTPGPSDYVFDGTVDYLDLLVMMEDWLMTDYSDVPLVAWYKLDGNADDSSGNGFNGTLENSPEFAMGVGGSGMSIDCNEVEYVNTDFNAVDLGIDGRSARTITAWVSVRSFNSAAIYEMGNGSDGEEFALRVRTTLPVGQWRAQYGGGVHHTITDLDTRGRWVHTAQVYTGGHSHVYVDGVLTSSMAVRLDTGTGKNFRIGRWGGNYFDGLIDDVRIYDKALSQTEVASVMAGGTAVTYYHPVESPMNLVNPEPMGSRAVNFADFAVFVDEWGGEQVWP